MTSSEWGLLRNTDSANSGLDIIGVIADLAACEKERDKWESIAERNRVVADEQFDRAEKAEAERDELAREVREYMVHKWNCNKLRRFMPDDRCTCGLDALLAKMGGEK